MIWCLAAATAARAGSFYPVRLNDPRAVCISPSGGDDAAPLQKAINQVQESTGQGIVLLSPGKYRLQGTVYVWPGIRVIGFGPERPILVLPVATPGYTDPSHEKIMIFFAGGRPDANRGPFRNNQSGRGGIPDANPGTFYSALANVDVEVEDGNPGAVVVRAKYAQHCFLSHIDFHLGPAIAAIHEGGNVVEDVHFFGGTHGIWTSKPSPGWQFTVIDSSFEGQRDAAILEHEAGLTLIRPCFRNVPKAVEIESNWVDELWVKDARLEDVYGPAFAFGMEESPRNEINLENVVCRNVPQFAFLRDSGKVFRAPGNIYGVKVFSHGLRCSDRDDRQEIQSVFTARRLNELPPPVASDVTPLPPGESWVNVRELGAKGDGHSDDTPALQAAIAGHRAIYLPSGFYIVRDTLKLRPDTVLIGLHPGATQLIIPDGTAGYAGDGPPKALIEAPRGGSNILIGIGLYTSGNNPRAVAALWKAGANSMINDVRFLGGHGTPLPDGSRENPYNASHSADPNPERHWDSQYPSLWVTDGGGGTFLDIWTPSTFARTGMLVSDTDTPGRAYQISSEHHVHNEIQLRNAANWEFCALQTEEERGESGFALPIQVDSCRNITFANFHAYRVISSFQPFQWAVTVSNSRDIHFRNVHCDSNSKASFDTTVADFGHRVEIRQHEFAWLDLAGQMATHKPAMHSPVVEPGAKVEKLAGGFFNISGGAVGPNGDFYFVDAYRHHIHCWRASADQLLTTTNPAPDPVNLAVDNAGNLLVVSYSGRGSIYFQKFDAAAEPLHPGSVMNAEARTIYLPVSDWHLNRESLSHPAAAFSSPDGTAEILVGSDFLNGATSWGVKSSAPIRSFGLGKAVPGKPFYVTDESALRTWAADVNPDGSLNNFRLFAEVGGEGVTTDLSGNVYVAAGEIYVYDPGGRQIDTVHVPERPTQLLFGGNDGRTLFITARTSLYSLRMRSPGR